MPFSQDKSLLSPECVSEVLAKKYIYFHIAS